MIVFPAIDLRGGSAVRLRQGRFDRETRYDDDPVGRARAFAEAGATDVHVVDLDGARDAHLRQTELVADIARVSGLRVQAGGGVRSADDARRLLDAGVERVVVGSLAARDPETTAGLIAALGADRVALALDVRLDGDGAASVATGGWQASASGSLWQRLDRFAASGCWVLCTDIARDGELAGPNVELYAEILGRFPGVRLQASGGVRDARDLRALRELGAAGAIVGKALYDGRLTVEEALAC